MILDSLTRLDKNARRLTEILSVLGRYGLASRLGGLPYDWIQKRLVSFDGQRLGGLSQEVRIRLALTELGTTFIKLGQMLSTREDVVGPVLAGELKQLQAQTPADSPEVVRETITAELGKPPNEIFADFEENALASASIGQVHRASLPNGQRVIVKVQHTGIEQRITSDLDLMMGLAEVLQKHVTPVRNYRPVATIREFRRTLLRELDFTSERRNLETFAANFAETKTVHFPVVYPELCARRVLTMEWLDGIPGSKYEELHASGIDLNEFALRAAEMYMEMIFRHGFYHADPHPGNFVLLPGGVVGVLDCGMVGRVDEPLREDLVALLLAVSRRDSDRLTEWVLSLGVRPPNLDRSALRSEIGDFVAEYIGQSLQDFDLGGALDQLGSILRRYQISLPPPLSLLLKTLVMLEGTARQLNPSFALTELLEGYQAKLAQTFVDPRRWLQKLERSYHDWDRLVKILPGTLVEVLTSVQSGTFELNHQHRRLEKAVHRLILGILSAALLWGAAQLLSRASQDTLGYGVAGFGIAFLVLACLLGFRLVWSIWKADHEKED